MFIRGFATGVVSAGVSCYTAYHLLSEASQPYVEYQETVHPVQDTDIIKYGTPRRSPELIVYKNHALCYDQIRRIPHWVIEHITRHKLQGNANRRHSHFKADPSVPVLFRVENEDYVGSGWSRGHLASAGNCKYDQDAMNETFLLSNIVPQDAHNNTGFWNRLEIYCRELTLKYDNVWIISGPIFMPTADPLQRNGRKSVHYEVIGSHDVAVPTHLFKVIVVENNNDKQPVVGAFVVPNQPVGHQRLLHEFQVPLDFIELYTGLFMLPSLDRRSAHDLCTVDGCKMKPWHEFQLYCIGQQIRGVQTQKQLEIVWKEVTRKDLHSDKLLIAAYEAKRNELEANTASGTKI
jgi:DNA/RNA endonuclease G (NUC1)